MKFVTKLVLIPIAEWEKVKKHLPAKNILNTVEVDQMIPVKQQVPTMNSGTKQAKQKKKASLKLMERKKKNAISMINYLPKNIDPKHSHYFGIF